MKYWLSLFYVAFVPIGSFLLGYYYNKANLLVVLAITVLGILLLIDPRDLKIERNSEVKDYKFQCQDCQ